MSSTHTATAVTPSSVLGVEGFDAVPVARHREPAVPELELVEGATEIHDVGAARRGASYRARPWAAVLLFALGLCLGVWTGATGAATETGTYLPAIARVP